MSKNLLTGDIRRGTAAGIGLFVVLMSAFFMQGCKKEAVVYLDTVGKETETLCESVEEETAVLVEETSKPEVCYVYICGAVVHPGVYILPAGSRIYEAVELAGGLLPEASSAAVNQAMEVSDGQMVEIPFAGEEADDMQSAAAEVSDDGRVNLNTASVEELMTLSGIGESKAKSIVAYRTEHGNFASIEELMKVDGIKEGVFERVKDNIKVN
jgi:competence protein ComEA